MANKAYVVQEPVIKNWKTGELVPKYDLSGVNEYGEPVVLLPPGNVMLSPQPMITAMERYLKNYTDDDWLVCVGDTIAIGLATGLALKHNRGRVNFLKWDRKLGKYIAIRAQI